MNTMQQEFDAVVLHLFKQGKPASTFHSYPQSNGGYATCHYRKLETDGTVSMCAVGCRIPDNVYVPQMDGIDAPDIDGVGTGVAELVKNFGPLLPPEIKAYENMFAALQSAHDSYFDSIAMLTGQLELVASKFGLTFTRPEGY